MSYESDDRDPAPGPDEVPPPVAAPRPAADRTAVDSTVSKIALHAWLERHRDDADLPGDAGRYALYVKGPTGFCA